MQVLLVDRSTESQKLFDNLSLKANEKLIQKRLAKIIERIQPELLSKRLRNKKLLYESELVVVFVDSKEAKQMNKTFRQKNYATDVLSFAAVEDSSLGELVICPRVILRQAREHELSAQLELTYMLIHGILHLLGYDHELSKSEEKLMFSIQDRVFESFS